MFLPSPSLKAFSGERESGLQPQGRSCDFTLFWFLSGFYLWNTLTPSPLSHACTCVRAHTHTHLWDCWKRQNCKCDSRLKVHSGKKKHAGFFSFSTFYQAPPLFQLNSVAQVPWIMWKLLPYVGTGKHVLIGCREGSSLGSLSFLPENVPWLNRARVFK